MVVPKSELGDDVSPFVIADWSGPRDSAEAATDTLDPADTAADLEQAGRADGYYLAYTRRSSSAAQGLLSVTTSVTLFETADAATAYVDRVMSDFARFRGKLVRPGTRLTRFEVLDVAPVGDHTRGGKVTYEGAGGTTTTSAFVVFRHERIVGAANVGAYGSGSFPARAERVARKLERRIVGVLTGEIDEQPVPLPGSE